jgi:ferredoxin
MPTTPRGDDGAAFWRQARRTPGYSFFDALHGAIYARWTYLYIAIGVGEHPLARWLKPLVGWLGRLLQIGSAGGASFADGYHGKVILLDAATQLVMVGEDVRLTDLERVIPYARARDIVLCNPDHIAVLDCPCRAARSNPCLPLDVCLVIGEPFVSMILTHHPHRSRRITPEEAVTILQAEQSCGHVAHAFFKDAMLDRFYAICNCCACCCGAMEAHRRGTPMLASSGYVAGVEADLCIGCGVCAGYCQFAALSVVEGRAVVDAAACMGCGVCVAHCLNAAISLARDPSRGVPLDIHALRTEARPVAAQPGCECQE